jgi:hypothetical protein
LDDSFLKNRYQQESLTNQCKPLSKTVDTLAGFRHQSLSATSASFMVIGMYDNALKAL